MGFAETIPDPSTRPSGRAMAAFGRLLPHDSHRHSGHPAYDFSLRREVESANLLRRLWVRDDNQLTTVHLALTANIAIAELHEIDGTVKFSPPFLGADLPLAGVNLHQRARPDEGMESVVLQADVSVHRLALIQMLQQANGNLVPFFNNPCKQVGALQLELGLELHGYRQCGAVGIRAAVHEMGSGRSHRGPVVAQIRDPSTEIGSELGKRLVIDGTQAI